MCPRHPLRRSLDRKTTMVLQMHFGSATAQIQRRPLETTRQSAAGRCGAVWTALQLVFGSASAQVQRRPLRTTKQSGVVWTAQQMESGSTSAKVERWNLDPRRQQM
uniref:Uncharacterized protein n=1 Tax=Anopheles coluzzii TaxID=1518534 RepID=A0A8W7PS58_ANOCL